MPRELNTCPPFWPPTSRAFSFFNTHFLNTKLHTRTAEGSNTHSDRFLAYTMKIWRFPAESAAFAANSPRTAQVATMVALYRLEPLIHEYGAPTPRCLRVCCDLYVGRRA